MDLFNRWGRMAVTFPERALVVRYEDLLSDAEGWHPLAGHWILTLHDMNGTLLDSVQFEVRGAAAP